MKYFSSGNSIANSSELGMVSPELALLVEDILERKRCQEPKTALASMCPKPVPDALFAPRSSRTFES